MKSLGIKISWLSGELDDQRETATFAALSILIDGVQLTRLYDRKSGGQRDSVQVPLYPLTVGLAANWWALLYEPRKSNEDLAFDSRHRLDVYMRGFVFPPIALWSAGEEALVVETPLADASGPNLVELLAPPLQTPDVIHRTEVEQNLIDLVQTTLARLRGRSIEHRALEEDWRRILKSMADPEERSYCITAGRLGLDPYDPDNPDLTTFSRGISPDLFGDVCEAARTDELKEISRWIRENEKRLRKSPKIDISQYGPPPKVDLSVRPWEEGYKAAEHLRTVLGIKSGDPKRALKSLFDGALDNGMYVLPVGPSAIEALTLRKTDHMQIGVQKRIPLQRRFHACRATYLAWHCAEGQQAGITIAKTRRQQASRAFAAELLAPAELLRERAGSHGLTPDDIGAIAREFECPEWVLIHQAENHRIPLRGID
jgi:hypothetical protein